MRGVEREGDRILGRRGDQLYPVNDDEAESFFRRWSGVDQGSRSEIEEFVRTVCGDSSLWGTDLTRFPGFVQMVAENLMDPQQRLREVTELEG